VSSRIDKGRYEVLPVYLVYVCEVLEDKDGEHYQGLSLYEPTDTTLGNMYYQFKNELFLSDHCNCRSADATREEDMVCRIDVDWSPQQIPRAHNFIRSTYHTHDQSFRTLKDANLQCACSRPAIGKYEQVRQQYARFDTVLVKVKHKKGQQLEPFVVVDFLPQQKLVRVRQLLRADQLTECSSAMPNELIWTSNLVDIKPKHIERKM
jgi:DNA (cytosine-5)-methyltransferase 1